MAKNIEALKEAAKIANQLLDAFHDQLVHIDQNGDIASMPENLMHGSVVLALSDDEYHIQTSNRCFVGYAVDRDLADENAKPFIDELEDWESTMILTRDEMVDNYRDLLDAIENTSNEEIAQDAVKGIPVKDDIEAIGVITNQLQRDGLKMDEFEIYQEVHSNGKYFVAFTGTAEEPQDFGSGDTYKWRLDKASNHLIELHLDEDKFDRDGCDIADHGKLVDHQKLYQARETDCKASELQEARKHAKSNPSAKVKDKSLTM